MAREISKRFEETVAGTLPDLAARYAGAPPKGEIVIIVAPPGEPEAAVKWSGLGLPAYGAAAAVNGVIFQGALDTLLKAYDSRTGRVLWVAPMLAPVASGPAVAGDRVYVGSGLSSSDLCVKGTPIDSLCTTLFSDVLGSLGGVTAFKLPARGEPEGVRVPDVHGRGQRARRVRPLRAVPRAAALHPQRG